MSDDRSLARLETLVLIAIGGFVGSNLRHVALGELSWIQAVLVANVCGSAALGFPFYEERYTGFVSRQARLLLTTGFISSLTTYSTFAVQTATAAGPVLAIGIVAANYGLGFAGVLLGRYVARRLGGGKS